MTILPMMLLGGGALAVTAQPPAYDQEIYRISGTNNHFIYLNDTIVSGGRSPFTKTWAIVQSSRACTITPSGGTIFFQITNAPDNIIVTATVRCTVTDSDGKTASVDIPLRLLTKTISIGL